MQRFSIPGGARLIRALGAAHLAQLRPAPKPPRPALLRRRGGTVVVLEPVKNAAR